MLGPFHRLFWFGTVFVCALPVQAWAEETPTARQLAPGVLTVIPADPEAGETYTGPAPIVEIVAGMPDLDWTPHFEAKSETLREKSQRVVFRRSVWALEFAFKPLRMIMVDVPQPAGKMQRKQVWYLVYRIKNNGYDLKPVGKDDQWGQTLYTPEWWNYKSLRFFPQFSLKCHETDKEYLDRLIPSAQRAIQERENPGVKLHNSVEIAKMQIPLSETDVDRSVWGVATWTDLDPRSDFSSIFVGGLTNAFQFQDPPGAFKPDSPPGTGRVFKHKVLQLNFWRAGDTVLEHEEEVRFGVPIDPDPAIQQGLLKKYGLHERLDYLWVYR